MKLIFFCEFLILWPIHMSVHSSQLTLIVNLIDMYNENANDRVFLTHSGSFRFTPLQY